MTQSGPEPAMAVIPGGMTGFESAISACFFPYEINSVRSPETFESAAATRNIGPLKLIRMWVGNSYAGGRLPASRNNERNTYVLNFVIDGVVHYQGRRAAVTNPGDLVLFNADHRVDTHRVVAGQSLAVSIPASLLRLHLAEAEDCCLIPLPTHEGPPAILRDCLMAYWRTQRGLAAPGYRDLSAAIIHLIGACFRNRPEDAGIDSRSMEAHFLRIRAAVEERLVDPELNADRVADRLGISKSYVFMIMHAANTTLGRFIRDQRLERSAQMLGDPSMSSRTVSEIALAVGFQDPAHFSRRFTEKFGQSPRAYRVRAQSPFTQRESG